MENSQLAEAEAAQRLAIEYHERTGNVVGLAAALEYLAQLMVMCCQWDAADQLFSRARQLYERFSSDRGDIRVLLGLADSHLRRGQLSQALSTIEAVLAREPKDKGLLAAALITRAQIASASADAAASMRFGQAGLALARELRNLAFVAEASIVLARMGEPVDELERALAEAQRTGQLEVAQRASHHLAEDARNRGDAPRASRLFRLALETMCERSRRLGPYANAFLQGPECTVLRQDAERADREFKRTGHG